MAATLGRLSVLNGLALSLVLASQQVARGEDMVADARTRPGQVVDSAGMFERSVVEKAQQEVDGLARRTSVPILIEIVPSLRGQSIEEVSLQRAMQTGREGLYILVARDEHKLEVRVSRRYRATINEATQRAIRDEILAALRADPKGALEATVKSITPILQKAAQATPPPSLAAEAPGGERQALILRNQVRLTLAGARKIIAGAEAKAAEMGLNVNIAVVDDGGHLLSFARMDGARPASGYTATTKAITAATFRQESGPMPRGAATPDLHLSLSLQNAAEVSGGKLTTLQGGVPVVVEQQVIGGVGVGGGSGEQDATIAKAGIASFLRDVPVAPPAMPAAVRE